MSSSGELGRGQEELPLHSMRLSLRLWQARGSGIWVGMALPREERRSETHPVELGHSFHRPTISHRTNRAEQSVQRVFCDQQNAQLGTLGRCHGQLQFVQLFSFSARSLLSAPPVLPVLICCSDSLLRAELEAKLLYLSPAEVLAVGPLSAPTRRLLSSFAAPAPTPGALGTSSSAGWSSGAPSRPAGAAAARLETVDGARYRDGGALAAAVGFYGSSSGGGGGTGGSSTGPGCEGTAAAGAAGAAAAAGASAGAPCEEGEEEEMAAEVEAAEGAVDSVLRLPPLVLRALAHSLDYLRPLGVEGVLRCGAAFRELRAAQELALSPNTLRCAGGGNSGLALAGFGDGLVIGEG